MERSIILLPGLGEHLSITRFATRDWNKRYGVNVVIPHIGWYDQESLKPKIQRLDTLIDDLHNAGPLALIGLSAGGSLAFNLFFTHQNQISQAINVCGRLRTGNPGRTMRSLEHASKRSLSFRESVLLFEQRENSLSKRDRERLMTIRPFFGDEVVPPETVALPGAHNTVVYSGEHVLSIGLSVLFPQAIFKFLVW